MMTVSLSEKVGAERKFWDIAPYNDGERNYTFEEFEEWSGAWAEKLVQKSFEFIELLKKFDVEEGLHTGTLKVIELGPAIYPCTRFVNSVAKRVLVDPLGLYFRDKFPAIGEWGIWCDQEFCEVDLERGYYDVVVADNALDHVYDLEATIAKIYNVLGDNGILAIPFLHVFDVDEIKSFDRDSAHPWSFSAAQIQDLLGRHNLKLEYETFDTGTCWSTAIRGVAKKM